MFSLVIRSPLLLINFILETTLGLSMIIKPDLIIRLGSVEISEALIRTCGMLALAVAFFSITSIFFIDRQENRIDAKIFTYSNLLVFNLALTIGLLYAAFVGEISYLGTIVHLPLAVAFALALVLNSSKTNQRSLLSQR